MLAHSPEKKKLKRLFEATGRLLIKLKQNYEKI